MGDIRRESFAGARSLRLHQKVSAFIAWRAPDPLCDACVADYLALSRRQVSDASHNVRGDGGFQRFHGRCSGCCTDRMVTMLAANEDLAAPVVQGPQPMTARPVLR